MKETAVVFTGLLYTAIALGQPEIRALVNAASYDPAVPRGCLVSIFGTGLARAASSAASQPLPTRLDGTAVLVGDLELEAPLYFVSPTQINFQLPFEVLGERLPIVVATAAGRSRPFTLVPAAAGPGIFTRSGDGKGPALAFGPNFQPVDTIKAGETVILYATGLGPTDPPVPSGRSGAAVEPLNRVTSPPEVFLGDAPAQVVFAGLAPGFAGVYQLNVIAQAATTDRVWVRSRGQASNVAEIAISPGQNVTNAVGAIELLYPVSQTQGTQPNAEPVGQSPHVIVARFTARLDIAPDAGPFSVAAIVDGDASSVVTFDPAAGTYEGVVTVPAEAPRYGDFSSTGFFPMDLFTCHTGPDGAGICHPFPGAIVPPSRIPLQERQALSGLPLPDSPASNRATGALRVRGEARRGSTFVVSPDTNNRLSTFGGYITVPLPPAPSRTVTLKLFIDGRRVASTEVAYRVGPFGF
jgi:uncharacterized protein (TIGR03437 family)